MDPTACLARIMELQAELTLLGEQQQYSTGEKMRNSGHPTYDEWKECWDNLIDWLLNGGFAPTLESLEPAGMIKRRVHSDNLPKYEMIERELLYSDRTTAGRHVNIYKNNGEFTEECGEAPHVLFIYGTKGDLVGTWNLFPK